jgi:cystathionine gamma-synthase
VFVVRDTAAHAAAELASHPATGAGTATGTPASFWKIFTTTSWQNLSLRGISQAGLVNNLNDRDGLSRPDRSGRRPRGAIVAGAGAGCIPVLVREWKGFSGMEDSVVSPETLAAQALGEADPVTGGLAPVINLSTNYEQQLDGSYPQGRVYTRADNPTSEHAERTLAALEGGGCACVLFGSGMAAATAVFQALLPGDHVLVSRVLYWGVRKWLAEFALAWGLDVEFIDTTDLDAVAAAFRPGRTRLLWVETPANPMWEITDIAAVCDLAHAAGARVAVDNTVPTPVLTRPFEHGADLVVHSATKYLNGHGDVLAGAVLSARPDPFWERIKSWRRNAGAMPGPFEAWLLQRGMRTLFLRVHRASQTALALAGHFNGHPALAGVLYPGLPDFPGHAIAARQMDRGFGGMLSIRLAGGASHAQAVLREVRVFKRATSLGGVESLIEHRRGQEGPSSPVPDDLLRVSVGIESASDLIADLEAALQKAPEGEPR